MDNGMRENIGLRFYLAGKLMKMAYGQNLIIPQEDVAAAWPPTGDHDRSFEGAFRAMALSNGGNRPEESYTTEQRIANDLDESFRFSQRAEDGKWHFERMLSCCPKCRGSGHYRVRKPKKEEAYFSPSADIDFAAVETFEIIKCDHSSKD